MNQYSSPAFLNLEKSKFKDSVTSILNKYIS